VQSRRGNEAITEGEKGEECIEWKKALKKQRQAAIKCRKGEKSIIKQ